MDSSGFHLLKTITAGLVALGIAMLLDLPQPRIAMTTVLVRMQPFSGMVLAKMLLSHSWNRGRRNRGVDARRAVPSTD